MPAEEYDVIIVGAGQSGIASARFYLEVHPDVRLIVIEKGSVVGGTWGRERVFPGFMSQASARTAGFSDVPFSPRLEQVDANGFFEAGAMTEYLEQYVTTHVYNDRSIRDRILFNTRVEQIEKIGAEWHVRGSKAGDESASMIFKAPKLIVASGATSVPNIPTINGSDSFKGKIIHSVEWADASFLQDEAQKRVAILGGGKSAADIVYECVKAGKVVSWVIRKSGKGPGAFFDGKPVGWFQNPSELGVSRLGSYMFLSGLGSHGWWYWFLFHTWLGKWFYRKSGESGAQQAAQEPNWYGREGARESFKLLDPKIDVQWLWHPAGIMNHEDWFDIIAKNVDVYREDVDHLEEDTIHLRDGRSIGTDLILLATGFVRSPNPFSEKQAVELGLPHDQSLDTPADKQSWEDLEDTATARLVKTYPVLAEHPVPPGLGDVLENHTPFRLHNNMVPINDHSIVFVGFAVINNMWYCSEVQSVYATAVLDGRAKLPTKEVMMKEVAKVNAYMRLRIPTYGREGNYWVFDMYPFFERMLGEVGLKSWTRSWWREIFMPLMPADLAKLKDEYLAGRR